QAGYRFRVDDGAQAARSRFEDEDDALMRGHALFVVVREHGQYLHSGCACRRVEGGHHAEHVAAVERQDGAEQLAGAAVSEGAEGVAHQFRARFRVQQFPYPLSTYERRCAWQGFVAHSATGRNWAVKCRSTGGWDTIS